MSVIIRIVRWPLLMILWMQHYPSRLKSLEGSMSLVSLSLMLLYINIWHWLKGCETCPRPKLLNQETIWFWHQYVVPSGRLLWSLWPQELVTELQMQSIFTDVGKLNLQDPAHSYVLPSGPGLPSIFPGSSAAWISQEGEAHFSLASASGGILAVSLPPHDSAGKNTS